MPSPLYYVYFIKSIIDFTISIGGPKNETKR